MIPPGAHALVDFVASGLPGQGPLRLAFGAPLRVLQTTDPQAVRTLLAEVEAESARGHWCVGYLAYEAAPAFDAALVTHAGVGPLAWFGVHAAPLDPLGVPACAGEGDDPATVRAEWCDAPGARDTFDADLRALLAAIEAGEVYQVNHSARRRGRLHAGSTRALFEALRRAQPEGFLMWLDAGDHQVLSLSPELFFDWDGDAILLRPMKGTAPRDADPAQDGANAKALARCPKERAENVMTVDLMRNDVSRIARPHSVRVPSLFDVQGLPTVWQMTSDITARTREGIPLVDVFAALFPCASVTGAPKARAMHHIRQREADARGVYCGAAGVVRPRAGAVFNVAIRTVVARGDALGFGVGSGITAGSRAAAEWREWRHKGGFVERASEAFALLETLALDGGVPRHLDHHLARMAQSARHFGFDLDPAALRACVMARAAAHPTGRWRLRLTLDARGTAACEVFAHAADPPRVTLALAAGAFTDAHSPFVRHKTTRRAHYDRAFLHLPGVFDTLLWNDDGELTECTRGNIALRLDGDWVTPALPCGLLPGIGRQVALAEGRVREAVIPVSALAQAREIAFLNSLRGWLPATLVAAGRPLSAAA